MEGGQVRNEKGKEEAQSKKKKKKMTWREDREGCK